MPRSRSRSRSRSRDRAPKRSRAEREHQEEPPRLRGEGSRTHHTSHTHHPSRSRSRSRERHRHRPDDSSHHHRRPHHPPSSRGEGQERPGRGHPSSPPPPQYPRPPPHPAAAAADNGEGWRDKGRGDHKARGEGYSSRAGDVSPPRHSRPHPQHSPEQQRRGGKEQYDRSGREGGRQQYKEADDRQYSGSGREQQQRGERDRGGGGREGGDGRRGGREGDDRGEDKPKAPLPPPPAPVLGLSGKLAAETNKVAGATAKFQPPPEAVRCRSPVWLLYTFKKDACMGDPLKLNALPYYLFGKDSRLCDVFALHPTCSGQHAVVCFREVERDHPNGIDRIRKVVPYLMDLESTNGTFLNGDKIEAGRFYELLEKDVFKFGFSEREYVLLNEQSAG